MEIAQRSKREVVRLSKRGGHLSGLISVGLEPVGLETASGASSMIGIATGALTITITRECERCCNGIAGTEKSLEQAQQHGIPYKGNYVADSCMTQLFFHDPDGDNIEIGTYPPVRQ
ncbi:MAG: hypothetical protein QGF59_22680 [Pirellulaceae bacterium]|jgi:hypothetical protein|nr:hypothetical protein [Pirellulaceae bacterium]MDP6721492.1 hypothetical protein [Pirellulaceae bacterium]